MKKARIILTLALALCFAGTGVWAQEAKDISVAFLVPLTGGGAFYGKVMRDVGKAVVDEMNQEGIKGFGKIEVRVFDTATDPAVTARKIERAVSQGANFIWGGFASGVEKMMMAKAEELRVPCLLTNEHTYEACPCKTKFGITPVVGTVELGKICAKYFQQENVKTYAIIGADYGWGHTWDRSLSLHLKGTGIKKVYENWHSFSKVDFSADIKKLKKLNPDAVVRPYGGAGEYLIIKQMKDSGYWPRIYIANGTVRGYHVTREQLGYEYLEGVTPHSCVDPENPRWVEFARTHKEKFGYLPTWLSSGMYDSLRLIKVVVEKAGTLDSEVLARTMRNSSFNGVSGFRCGPFLDSGYVRETTVYLNKWVNGPPAWSKDLPVHREVVCKMDVTPMCKEEIDKLLKKAK